jgi:excisionase family DNA binding protein
MSDLLKITEVATLVRVRPRTVRAWLAQRKIGYIKAGRGVRIPRAELTRFLEIRNPLPPDFKRLAGSDID